MGLGFRRGSLRPTARGEWVLTPGGGEKNHQREQGGEQGKILFWPPKAAKNLPFLLVLEQILKLSTAFGGQGGVGRCNSTKDIPQEGGSFFTVRGENPPLCPRMDVT